MGVSLGWLFWPFLKTEGGEKDQPPAQSPGSATLNQTEEEVDRLLEVFGAVAPRVGVGLPMAGISFPPAKPERGAGGRVCGGGAGPPLAHPPAWGCGPRCRRSASDETPTKVTVGASLAPAGAKGLGAADFTLRHPGIDKPWSVLLLYYFFFNAETATVVPPLLPAISISV